MFNRIKSQANQETIMVPKTTYKETDLYVDALACFEYEQGANPWAKEHPAWKNSMHEVLASSIEPYGVAIASSGAAKVIVTGNVGENSIILCRGGGAKVTIFGDVGANVRILCVGGGATVIVHGNMDQTAQVIAIGGGAAIVALGRRDVGTLSARGGGAQVLTRD